MIKKQIVEIDDNWLARLVSEYYSNNNFKPDPEPTKVGLCKYLLKHIELHEANKPKLEPVGYYAPNLDTPPFNRGVLDAMYQITGDWIPLYTTPPTREPLSEHEINNIVFSLSKGSTLFDFASLVEQAHGIGTPHEPT